jgi:hypothetical protein
MGYTLFYPKLDRLAGGSCGRLLEAFFTASLFTFIMFVNAGTEIHDVM